MERKTGCYAIGNSREKGDRSSVEKADFYQRALAAIELKRWDIARRELTNVLAQSPQEARALSLMSACSFNLGEVDTAIEQSKSAIKCDPKWTHAYYVLSLGYTSKGRFREAQRAIKPALAEEPENPDYLMVMANLHFAEVRWKEGLQLLEHALSYDPAHASCLRLKAYGLRQSGRTADADEVVKQALSLHPEDARLYAEAGWAAIRKDASEARTHFEEALRLDPTDPSYIRAVQEARSQNRWYFRIFRRFTNRWIIGPYYLLWMIFSRDIPAEWSALWLYFPLIYLVVCGLLTSIIESVCRVGQQAWQALEKMKKSQS